MDKRWKSGILVSGKCAVGAQHLFISPVGPTLLADPVRFSADFASLKFRYLNKERDMAISNASSNENEARKKNDRIRVLVRKAALFRPK